MGRAVGVVMMGLVFAVTRGETWPWWGMLVAFLAAGAMTVAAKDDDPRVMLLVLVAFGAVLSVCGITGHRLDVAGWLLGLSPGALRPGPGPRL